ncbi:MAG: metallophosphoesterase, partial [Solirubrobacteraceae bacterium]
MFFSRPGTTLGGRPLTVTSQAAEGFPENVLWTTNDVVLATLHVVGSGNDRAPWFGPRETNAQRLQRRAEFARRMDADLAWLDRTFEEAEKRGADAVVLAMQANMFVGSAASGFAPIINRLTDRAKAFDGSVLLLNGDTHRYV